MGQATRTYVGLDIGTTKISCIIVEANGEGVTALRVVGVGNAPSEGLRRGVVVDLEKTVASIARAVDEAQRMAGIPVRGVHAGIAGDHIRSINSRGVIAVSRKDNEIGPADVERVIEAAKAIAIPTDREIIHVIPQEFIVDDQNGIKDPVGMTGVRLEAEVHIITSAVTAWCSSTSAAAPPTSRCSSRARSVTPRSSRSAARTSPTTSPSGSGRR